MTKTEIVEIVIEYTKKTPNNMELGEKIRELVYTLNDENTLTTTLKDTTYIYESPDGGDTVYRRESGKDERVLVKGL